jgi:glutathione S-transferase
MIRPGTTPDLVLWASTATTSTIVHMVLAEAGAAFETRFIGLRAGDNRRPEFLAINPKGEVPALVVDGVVITETPAICLYVAERFPDAGLVPAEPLARARCMSWLAWASYRQAAAWIPAMVPGRSTRDLLAQPGVAAAGRRKILKALGHLDAELADGREYLMGSRATLPDFYVAMQGRWARRLALPLPGSVAAHLDRVLARPAVRHVLAVEGLLAPGSDCAPPEPEMTALPEPQAARLI